MIFHSAKLFHEENTNFEAGSEDSDVAMERKIVKEMKDYSKGIRVFFLIIIASRK